MGYYADLIKEKRNSKYSYKLIDKGYYGVRKEEEYHKWVVQTWYGTKLVDEQEVTGPKSKAEAQGQKNVSAFERRYPENAKEEKDNADSAYIEASQKAERIINRMLQSRDKKEAKRFLEKIGWETRTLGEDPADYARAIRRAVRNYPEKSAEILSNEKEEKENEDPQIATLRRKALQKIKEAQKKADWYGDTIMQKFEKDITYAEEEDVPELAGALDRYLPKFEAKVKSFGNSDDEKGYYAKLAEEKKNAKMVSFAGKTFRIEDDGSMAQSEYDKLRERYFDEQDRIKEERGKLQREMDKLARDFNEVKNKIKNLGSIY